VSEGRWLELADGVYTRRYRELDLTVGLVVGDGGCLVIDTRGDAEQGAELAAAVREVTAAPWQVAITHAHFDHCFGTAAFDTAAVDTTALDTAAVDTTAVDTDGVGRTTVWAHRRCAADLAVTGESQRAHWVEHYAATRPEVARAIAAAPIRLPDALIDDRATVSVGGREVVLAHPGRGHTGHDLVAWVPDCGVVFAGDLVEQGAPPAFEDAYPLDWPAAVDAVLALGPTVVVPGHGDPVDQGFVRAQRAELAAIADLCRGRGGASPYPPDVTRTALARAGA